MMTDQVASLFLGLFFSNIFSDVEGLCIVGPI